jgi:hypothetical protein
MTTESYMQNPPPCDLLIVDEIDQTVLEQPYYFPNICINTVNGIWNWKKHQVIGLSATAYGDIQ